MPSMEADIAAVIRRWQAGFSKNQLMQAVLDYFVEEAMLEYRESGAQLDADDVRNLALQDFVYFINGTG